MTRSQVISVVAAIVLLLAGLWFYRHSTGKAEPPYRFATVERGSLEAAVSATGTLGAVTTVQVGTQVSGQVSAIYADFNDPVKEGQLIARIDPTLQEQAVREAQAGLERSQAELEQTTREFERNQKLFEQKVLTEIEFNSAKYNLAVAQANVKSAQVTLDRARRNLSYTSIHAPIDGIVVERTVDVGQTVAASLSAPQLFLIAKDLSEMQILASVDESDIGLIREQQPARFTVQAYPNESFSGTVRQVRLQSKTLENVVSYTVVVSVDNEKGRLLPGMTATVEFLTGEAHDVLLVPNAALRFRATEAMFSEVRAARAANGEAGARGAETGGEATQQRAVRANAAGANVAGAAGRRPNGAGAAGRRPPNVALLWYLNEAGKLATVRVHTGITDGQRTEIQGEGLKEGMQVIVGVTQAAPAAPSTSPFQAPMQGFVPMGPGGF